MGNFSLKWEAWRRKPGNLLHFQLKAARDVTFPSSSGKELVPARLRGSGSWTASMGLHSLGGQPEDCYFFFTISQKLPITISLLNRVSSCPYTLEASKRLSALFWNCEEISNY